MREQMLAMKMDEQEVAVAGEMTMSMRFTHLQGKPLQEILPRAVDDMDDYEWQEGEVLGGQIVGAAGAGKRIDILATALHAGMTVAEMKYLDLAYAPPVSPVWDPVLVALGRLAEKL